MVQNLPEGFAAQDGGLKPIQLRCDYMQQNTASSRGSSLRSASLLLCRLLCVVELVMEGTSSEMQTIYWLQDSASSSRSKNKPHAILRNVAKPQLV